MARFRTTIKGQRGEASRLGGTKSGIVARINGWDAGITVIAEPMLNGAYDDIGDAFAVFQTSGSSKRAPDRLIGRLTIRDGLLDWHPA